MSGCDVPLLWIRNSTEELEGEMNAVVIGWCNLESQRFHTEINCKTKSWGWSWNLAWFRLSATLCLSHTNTLTHTSRTVCRSHGNGTIYMQGWGSSGTEVTNSICKKKKISIFTPLSAKDRPNYYICWGFLSKALWQGSNTPLEEVREIILFFS